MKRVLFLLIFFIAGCQNLPGQPGGTPPAEPCSVQTDPACTKQPVEPEPTPAATLVLQNLEGRTQGALAPGFYDDHLVFSRIGSGLYEGMQVHEKTTLRILNTGTRDPLSVTTLAISPGFALPGGETSLTIAPGEFYDLEVAFTEASGDKGVRPGTLTLGSNDTRTPTQTVSLAGVYMVVPEAGAEISPQQLMNAFDLTIYIPLPLSADPASPLAGKEVRSKLWARVDPQKPVYVRQIASFHSCCKLQHTFEIPGPGGGSFANLKIDGQSILPRSSGGQAPAEMRVNPTAPFDVRIAEYTTNADDGLGLLGIRFWPVRDRDSVLLKNTYLVIQDFVQKGCGTKSSNCDYNDNIYIVTNIAPVP